MALVIFGGSGKIGSKAAEILLEKKAKVIVVARSEDKVKSLKDKGAIVATGDIKDVSFVTKTLTGAKAAFVMNPPTWPEVDPVEEGRIVGEATVNAIKASGIKYIVNLSSIGAHTEKSGVVKILHFQEKRLNQLTDVNILHLRPTYFMENLLSIIGVIKQHGVCGTVISKDKSFPLIATQDIGSAVADSLLSLNFQGHSVHALLGTKNYTFAEITSIIGKGIGKPDLQYVQFSPEDAKKAYTSYGASPKMAELLVELYVEISNGLTDHEKRTPQTTTKTSVEEFVSKVFVPAYNQK